MKIDLQKPARGLSRVGLGAIAFLMTAVMVLLFISSMTSTTDMNMNNDMQERIDFTSDSFWLNVLWLILCIAAGVVLILVARRLGWERRMTAAKLSWYLLLWVCVMGSLWVVQSMSSPTHDSLIVTRAGVAAALDDLSRLEEAYFERFPFQLGYVFWTELWSRLFGVTHGAYLFMEFVNVACLAFGEMALVRLTERLFHKWEVTFATALALALFVQPIMFTTFLYGTMPGFCFAAWSMLLFVRYLQTDKWRFIIGSSLLLAVSVSLKLNNMILLVAMVIILLLHLLRGKCLRQVAAILILCLSVLILKNVGMWQYELRTDKDFGDGIPMTSWLAMGLNESKIAPGWYNGKYTVTNFNSVDGNTEAASEKSMAVIKERVAYFTENPAEAADFFKDKVLSQWNETTYQSIWNNQVRGQYMEKFGLAAYVCGEGEYSVKAVLDVGVQCLYGGMLIAVVLLFVSQIRKKADRRTDECALWLIPLTILGGFLYHALFEAKSQYVITYVTMMIPFAVWGFYEMCSFVKAHIPQLVVKLRGASKGKVTKNA